MYLLIGNYTVIFTVILRIVYFIKNKLEFGENLSI